MPEVDQRLALIGAWKILPDFAGVNFHEPGALKVAAYCFTRVLRSKRGFGMSARPSACADPAYQSIASASSSNPLRSREMPMPGSSA